MRCRCFWAFGFAAAVLLLFACTKPNPNYLRPSADSAPSFDGAGFPDRATLRDGRSSDRGRAPDATLKQPPHGVDVLFVIDNSMGMTYPQKWLAQSISALTDGLEMLPGAPRIRVGVVTTDIGVGPYATLSCDFNGDGAKLLLDGECPAPPSGVHYVESDGKVTTAGVPLRDAVACMIQLGEGGCGFEQPLEAMRLALSTANPGFLRPDAALAVVVLTNEDDCSSKSQTLYDPKDYSLGPYNGYRCFQYGVLCQGQKPPLAPAVLYGCQPGGTWLYDVKSRYVDFLQSLKPPGWVSLLVIAAPPQSATEVLQEGQGAQAWWYVKSSCTGPSSTWGDPAFRLTQLVDLLGARALATPICSPPYSTALKGLLSRVQAAF